MSAHLSTSGYEISQVHLVTLSHTSFPRISLSRCGFIQCYPRWAAFTRRPLPTPTPYTLQETDAPEDRVTPPAPRIRRREGLSASVGGREGTVMTVHEAHFYATCIPLRFPLNTTSPVAQRPVLSYVHAYLPFNPW